MFRLLVKNKNIVKKIGYRYNGVNIKSDVSVSDDKNRLVRIEKLLQEHDIIIKYTHARIGEHGDVLSGNLKNKHNITCDVERINRKMLKIESKIQDIDKGIYCIIFLLLLIFIDLMFLRFKK